MSALGFGSMAGALSLAFFGRGARPHFMLAMAATLGIGEIVLAGIARAGAPALLAMALLPILGFAMTSTMALANTTVQTATPHELRGRVLSVYLTVFAGSAPFGAIVAGALANALGTPASLAICGVVTAMAAGVVAMLWGAMPAVAMRLRWISSSPLASRSSLPDTTTGED
jgi:MFS family permease